MSAAAWQRLEGAGLALGGLLILIFALERILGGGPRPQEAE